MSSGCRWRIVSTRCRTTRCLAVTGRTVEADREGGSVICINTLQYLVYLKMSVQFFTQALNISRAGPLCPELHRRPRWLGRTPSNQRMNQQYRPALRTVHPLVQELLFLIVRLII